MSDFDNVSCGWEIGDTQLVGRVLSENFVPLSFVSEYTRNSIQAIQRRGVGDKIVWGVKEVLYEGKLIRKLSITDNGPGLSDDPNEIQSFVGGFAISGYETGIRLNHGFGAKASAAMWNGLGVLYRTWGRDRHGVLRSYRVAINPRGLVAQANGRAVEEVDFDEGRPEMIIEHGTEVIFMGNTEDQDTTVYVGDGTRLARHRIFQYLNTRFYSFPEDIRIYAPRGFKTKAGDERIDRVVGFRRCWIESGTKQASNPLIADHGAITLEGEVPARIHYFVMNEDKKRRENYVGIFDTRHSIAFLYEDELYTYRAGPKAISILQAFVGMACDRVALVIEPLSKLVNPEGGRQMLRYRGDELAFDMWACAFRDSLPDSIKEVQKKRQRACEAKFDSETLTKALKKFYPELRTLGGNENLEGNVSPGPKTLGSPPSRGTSNGVGDQDSKGGTSRKPKIADIIQQITSGSKKIRSTPAHIKFPGCQWLSDTPDQYLNMDQKPEDYLLHKAAFYDEYENMIRCNWDFFKDRYAMLRAEYQDFSVAYGESQVDTIIQIEIQVMYTRLLSDAVLAMLIRRKDWDAKDFKAAVGDVGLTAVAVGRGRIEDISRAISDRLESEFGMDQKMKETKRELRRRQKVMAIG